MAQAYPSVGPASPHSYSPRSHDGALLHHGYHDGSLHHGGYGGYAQPHLVADGAAVYHGGYVQPHVVADSAAVYHGGYAPALGAYAPGVYAPPYAPPGGVPPYSAAGGHVPLVLGVQPPLPPPVARPAAAPPAHAQPQRPVGPPRRAMVARAHVWVASWRRQ